MCVFMYVLRCGNFILVCKCIIGNSKSVIERESHFSLFSGKKGRSQDPLFDKTRGKLIGTDPSDDSLPENKEEVFLSLNIS